MKAIEIQSYDYINAPYRGVRDALLADPAGLFAAATRAAADRARSLSAGLHVTIGAIDVSAEISVTIGRVVEDQSGPFGDPITRIPVRWEAARHPRLFPLMNAVLSIYSLTSTETQLDFAGEYEPPLGPVGGAVDALVGHRVAQASVHRFVGDVASHLRRELGAAPR